MVLMVLNVILVFLGVVLMVLEVILVVLGVVLVVLGGGSETVFGTDVRNRQCLEQ